MIVTVRATRSSRPSRQPQVTRVCAFCGAETRPTGAVRTKRNPDQPDACGRATCQIDLHAWKRKHDPAYAARRREMNRRWAATRATPSKRAWDELAIEHWAACTGCGRRFPSGSLVKGRCGGYWCPGQPASAA